MTYTIGMDPGSSVTAWATVSNDDPQRGIIGCGAVPSVVAVAEDGRVLAGAEVTQAGAGVRASAADFVSRLGDAEPVIVNSTPYGVESLLGLVLSSIMRAASDQQGAGPGVVALAHADGLDEYRCGLLIEAARLVGVSPADVELVAHGEALAALADVSTTIAEGLEVAVGAAMVGRARRASVAPASDTAVVATAGAAGAAATVAGGATLRVSTLGEAVITTAARAPGTGPAYTGTPLPPPGTGYTGTPLPPPGTGTGTGPAYTGTPLPAPGAGYTGTPPAEPDDVPEEIQAARSKGLRSRRVPIVVAATAALVLAGGTAAAVLANQDSSTAASRTTVTVIESRAPAGLAPVAATVTTQPPTTLLSVIPTTVALAATTEPSATTSLAASATTIDTTTAITALGVSDPALLCPAIRTALENQIGILFDDPSSLPDVVPQLTAALGLLPANLQPQAIVVENAYGKIIPVLQDAFQRHANNSVAVSTDPAVTAAEEAFLNQPDVVAASEAIRAYLDQTCPDPSSG